MSSPRRAVLAVLLLAAARDGKAQSLGEAARKAEESRKAPSQSTLVFDARDLNPAAAQQELLHFQLTDARWRPFLAADRQMADAFKRDPEALARLQNLQATSVRALERFLQREPGLFAALTSAGADPHEYAYTQLALGLAVAVARRADAERVLAEFPDTVKGNVAFVKAHERDVKGLGVGAEALALRITPLPSPASASSASAAAASVRGADPEAANASRSRTSISSTSTELVGGCRIFAAGMFS